MPIYEYRCAACGFQSEYLQKVSDPIRNVCPQCGQETFKKLLTAAGFQLRGSGWYATDFKAGGARPAATKPEKQPEKQAGESKPGGGEKPAEPAPACGAGACPACS